MESKKLDRRTLIKTAGIGAVAGGMTILNSKRAKAQSQNHSYWVHGNSARVQFPDRISTTEFRSTGAYFQGQPGTENWFHLPFTNPVTILGQRPQVAGALLRALSSENVFVREVKLFDGNFERGFSGDLETTGDITQFIDITSPTLFIGAGISALVEFTDAPGASELEIIGAGLDLLIPESEA